MANDVYTSPLASRYASPYMLHLFSPDSRFQTWRRLWVALARAQHQLGLPITARQVHGAGGPRHRHRLRGGRRAGAGGAP